MTTGVSTTCARLMTGQVRCWGSRTGSGSWNSSDRPVVVSNVHGTGPLTDVARISGSGFHTCALLTNGTAVCWGAVAFDGSADAIRPVPVNDATGNAPLTGITQLSAGPSRTCARLDSGEARCWGRNETGALGDQTTTNSLVPVTVLNTAGDPMTGVSEIVTGTFHTCALLISTEVQCWGDNSHGGQLGDASDVASSLTPVPVVAPGGTGTLTGVRSLEAVSAFSTCAILDDGRAVCWGPTPSGQSGGTADDPRFVVDDGGTDPADDIVAISPGANGACFVSDDGRAWCIGGALGRGPVWVGGNVPGAVLDRATGQELAGVVDISLGWDVGCATLAGGEARCWGDNRDGTVGDGTKIDRHYAEPVIAP